MIPGYDDYQERVEKGLLPYTMAGLIAKIDELNDRKVIMPDPGDAKILSDYLELCKSSAFDSPFPALIKRYYEAMK